MARNRTIQITPTRFLHFLTIGIFLIVTLQQATEFWWGGYGSDARIYYRAAEAFVSGGDIWAAYALYSDSPFHYYAAPSAAMVLAPLTVLPESVFVPVWIALQAACAMFVIRRLRMPWWWLAFPPIVSGVLSGNPSLSVLAALVATNPMANGLAVMLKIYAIVPVIAESRVKSVVAVALLLLASIALAPSLWAEFFGDAAARNAHLMDEADGGFSGFQDPALFAMGLVAIAVLLALDRRRAGWLAPIALWPASQFHWATLAFPVMTPVLALGLALPVQGLPPAVIAIDAWIVAWRRLRRSDNDGSPGSGTQSSPRRNEESRG
jgi:hypothetical protein